MLEKNSYIESSNGSNTEQDLKQSKLNQNHEKNILSEKNKHELEVLDRSNKQEVKLKNKELGWFGIFFGGKDLISLNISGILIIFLITTGLILSVKIYSKPNDLDSILKIWGIITPLITLTLGYIFGSKTNNG